VKNKIIKTKVAIAEVHVQREHFIGLSACQIGKDVYTNEDHRKPFLFSGVNFSFASNN
jgi:hypothetical protein